MKTKTELSIDKHMSQIELWSLLKRLIPNYIKGDISNGASDIMNIVKDAQDDIAVNLDDTAENEELYTDLALSVDVIEAAMAGMELVYDSDSYREPSKQRKDAIARFKFFANKIRL